MHMLYYLFHYFVLKIYYIELAFILVRSTKTSTTSDRGNTSVSASRTTLALKKALR